MIVNLKLNLLSPDIMQININMTDSEKLDKILERLEDNNRFLQRLLNLIEKDTPGRDFLLNLGANLVGEIIKNGNK